MKWLFVLVTLVCAVPAHAQGTIPVAMNVQSDINGPLRGALLYTYVVGTVATPEIAYSDVNLSLPLPWPIPADNNGRLPMFYLPAGSVHARLTDASGNIEFDYANVLVIGGTTTGGGGGGGGGTVDPTTVFSTGDVKFRLTNETLAGWVILNGQTIGNATSGATGLASSTAQALYVYLWTFCPNTHCPVTTGRGATALADFSAGKQLQLMDMRDSIPVGRDCMGNSCAGGLLLSNITSGGTDTADTPGAFGGLANYALTQPNLPNVTNMAVTIPAGQGSHSHTAPSGEFYGNAGTFVTTAASGSALPTYGITATAAATLPAMTGTASTGGSNTPFALMNPFKLGTYYIKL